MSKNAYSNYIERKSVEDARLIAELKVQLDNERMLREAAERAALTPPPPPVAPPAPPPAAAPPAPPRTVRELYAEITDPFAKLTFALENRRALLEEGVATTHDAIRDGSGRHAG